jgi:hypothetical protein
VREIETDAYRWALASASDPASAERLLLESFARLAPSIATTPQTVELKERLHAYVRKLGSRKRRSPALPEERVDQAVAVSESLHVQIVDLLEEQQAVEPVGRRRRVLLGLGGILLVAALAAFIWVRLDALASAQPKVTDVNPPAGAKEVPLRGDFKVAFGAHAVGTPTLRLEPADGVLESPRWDGNTLIVGYSGLRLATRYQVVLGADYRSRFKDIGHLVKRWSFTAEGYPVLVQFAPTDGQTIVTRTGAVTIDFNHRPPVDPQVHIVPADGSMVPGHWTGSTWVVGYSGLKPLTSYQLTAIVDYGVRAANIRRQWAFTTEPGAPLAGTPVIWYSMSSPWMSGEPQRLVAIDWTGTMVGTMYQTPAIQQSPDGSILANRDGTYLDRSGAQVRTASPPNYFNSMLADDNRSLCEIRPYGTSPGEQWVFVGRVDGAARRVAPAGVMPARGGLSILACSVLNNRVVVGDFGMNGLAGVRVLEVSSGRLIYQRTYPTSSTSVVSSHDGKYLAEQTTTYGMQGEPVAGQTTIRRTNDGQVVGHAGTQRVLRFSWDDMRVVTGTPFPGMSPTASVELKEWQTGKTLWRQPGSSSTYGTVYALAQPNGPNMAIALSTQSKSGDVDQLWLVAADGQAIQVLNELFYPAFASPF